MSFAINFFLRFRFCPRTDRLSSLPHLGLSPRRRSPVATLSLSPVVAVSLSLSRRRHIHRILFPLGLHVRQRVKGSIFMRHRGLSPGEGSGSARRLGICVRWAYLLEDAALGELLQEAKEAEGDASCDGRGHEVVDQAAVPR